MKRRTLLNLWRAFSQLEGLKHDVKFSYFLAKNKVQLRPEMEILDTVQTPKKEFIEFEQKRIELAKTYADKDVSGNPKIHNGQYVIYNEKEKFNEEIQKLKENYKQTIEEREEQLEDYEKLLSDEIDFKPFKIKFNDLPKQIESNLLEIFIEANIIDED